MHGCDSVVNNIDASSVCLQLQSTPRNVMSSAAAQTRTAATGCSSGQTFSEASHLMQTSAAGTFWLMFCTDPCRPEGRQCAAQVRRQCAASRQGAGLQVRNPTSCCLLPEICLSSTHADLKGGNVLLKSADNARGFKAKVADFGLARHLRVEERIQSNKYGTITHCPPELLLEGAVSKVSS